MDQCEDREDRVRPSRTSLGGEHEDQRKMKMLLVFWILLDVSLKVSAVQVFVGDPFVLLLCKVPPLVWNSSTVVWTRSDLKSSTVHKRGPEGDDLADQNPLYRNRTSMKTDALETGDLSLNLTRLQVSDTGNYTCNGNGKILNKVHLQVKDPFPLWARIILGLLVFLVLVASGAVLFHFRHNFKAGYKVEIEEDSGVESVLLPCRTTVHLPEDTKVEWTDSHGNKVHVYQDHCEKPEKQIRFYRTRTKMYEDLLKTGDLSLTLRHPTHADTDTYTCTAYSRRKHVLMKKQVQLEVKVQQVEVDSGADDVLLPCGTRLQLLSSFKVEWRDSENMIVHMFHDGCNHLEQRDRFYRNRTEMNEDLLQSGDLSLTLKYPTYGDSNIYTCTVYNQEGNILFKKQVQLQVKDCQVEVTERAESILPFKVPPELVKNSRVVWWRCEPGSVVSVCVYEHGFDHRNKHNQLFRSKMKTDLLETGDLSLTLKKPLDGAAESYRCGVWRGGKLLMWTTVHLCVKGGVQLQDKTEDMRDRNFSIDMTPLMADESDY